MARRNSEPVLVLGNGAWGLALAMILARRGRTVRVWGHDAASAARVQHTREHPGSLPGVQLPPTVQVSHDLAELAVGTPEVLAVVPTQFLRRTLEALGPLLPREALYVSCSKGFERGTFDLPSRIIRSVLPSARVAALSGPSHAEEVSRGLPAALVAAAPDLRQATQVQELLGGPRFRVYTSTDLPGVEIAGAVKNVIALASGISDGLGFGDNARAALVTRGLREMTRLGLSLGARAETFAGLAGMGDLIATCTSRHSRNHSVGLRIAQGETLEKILASTTKVAEGVETARALAGLSEKLGVSVPITREVHAVLFEGKPPRDAVEALMAREAREEAE